MALLKIEERKGKNEQFMVECLEEALALVKAGKVMQLIVVMEKENTKETGPILQIKRCCKTALEMHGLMAIATQALLEGK